ncbi:MAG: hypothetical protein H6R25_2121 [Proteobacteria bacterium]|nr:hypothetical protein [Pseudomonadota bacterium]
MMNKIRTLAHVRTLRMVKSFRACANMTGPSQILIDSGRVYFEECRRLNRVQCAKCKRILLRKA